MDLVKISRFISLILRHKPETIGIKLDSHGYANTKQLIAGVNRKYPEFNMDVLKHIVETDDKQRYSFKKGYKLIRANQGHSVSVDLELKQQEPPELLYHGTSTKYLDSIIEKGIISKSRQYVHLSNDVDTAHNVGLRHGGGTVILIISAKLMWRDGYKFFLSDNGVWLADKIPTKYFTLWHINSDFDLKHLKVIVGEYDNFFEHHERNNIK